MGLELWFKIEIKRKNIEIKELISIFEKNNISLFEVSDILSPNNDKIFCLDKGDDGDWTYIGKDDLDEFYNLISYKIDNKERIGIKYYFNNDIGISLIYENNHYLSGWMRGKFERLEDYISIDYYYYLNVFIKPLLGYTEIESVYFASDVNCDVFQEQTFQSKDLKEFFENGKKEL